MSAIDECGISSSFGARYQRLSTSAGPFSFHLMDGACHVIAHSGEYGSMHERDAAVAACKRNGPTAAMQDNT